MRFEETVLQTIYAGQDFEEFILSTALNYYLFPIGEYEFFQDTRLRANLRTNAFLNSVTSLRDQFPKFRSRRNLTRLHDEFKGHWDEARTNSAAFSFLERLRNYAQHQTQPIGFVTTGGAWDRERDLLETRMSVYVEVEPICRNREVSMDEAEKYKSELGNRADISLIFRESMGIIGKIVKKIRDRTKEDFDHSINNIEEYLSIMKSYVSEDVPCHFDILVTHEGDVSREFTLFPDFTRRAQKLRRTFLMENHHKHFVSNRAFGHK